jgi:stage II sporulation protein GA (sporulation sigma-E factor processing peptidase)
MNKPEVYVDLVFFLNFIMDFLILWATARLAGIKVVYSRIGIAAFLGGVYAVAYIIPVLDFCYSLPAKIIFSCLLLLLAVRPRTIAEFKKAFLYFYAINFTVAGATIASSYLFNTHLTDGSFSYLWLVAGVVCTVLIGIYGEKYLRKNVIPQLLKFGVELRFNKKSCYGKGFLDTGNGLRDPLTNRPVVVAEYGFLRECLPDDLKTAMESSKDDNDMLDALTRSIWASRLRLIPFSSIGKKNGILVGVRADEILLNLGEKNVLHKNMVVGIYKDQLSPEGNYQMLIPAEIVEQE